ncbi:MAG: AraC family transcriptional regulator, transcriptional activator of pobA [Solirubrobacteraceae bacterium]|nr:AraC family transcriptional regulator, transcriptional activator of pobA [Solirubrobacteraceae bacterium]
MSVLRADPVAPARERAGGPPTVDRLANRHDPVEVVLFDALEVGCDGDGIREPHRHDYHELIWTRAGAGRHLLDNRSVPVVPGTITVIGRGQVHVFERAHGLVGAAVRFGDDLLHEGPIAGADPAWLFAGCGGWNVTVPDSHHAALEATIATLAAESAGPLDPRSADLQRHLLSVLLLWIERWYDGQHTERRDSGDAALAIFRRFSGVLERDFAAHHDAAHYAEALAMPQAALSHALSGLLGQPTKELITDRVMLEATRLLRFTDRSIGEIAYQTGFGDPLYFSRAFKRHVGEPPTVFRDRARGIAPD